MYNSPTGFAPASLAIVAIPASEADDYFCIPIQRAVFETILNDAEQICDP